MTLSRYADRVRLTVTRRNGARAMKYGDRVLLKEYKNGNKLWGTVTRCSKCGATGKVIWSYADGICFECDGKGWYYVEDREYTPENLAKKQAKEAARRAEWEAEVAQREAERAAEEAKREAERLAEIERNRGEFIGNAGDKIQMEVTLERTFWYERPCFNAPWKTEMITGYVFKTDDGNTLVWKTTGGLYRKEYTEAGHLCDRKGRYDPVQPDEGERVTIKATIKDHEEYNNVNQTILNRVSCVG
jgi:predicted  nucleic acid-binding Zn-ribbon protein